MSSNEDRHSASRAAAASLSDDDSLNNIIEKLSVLTVSTGNEAALQRAKEELIELKRLIAHEVRRNFRLENQVKDLDSKIHLLIRNRLAVQDISLNADERDRTAPSAALQRPRSLYQRVLSQLQGRPVLVARLAKAMQAQEIPRFVEITVFTMFSDQYSSREEHLLLSSLEILLQMEVDQCTDLGTFLRGNTCFTSLVQAYTRRGTGLQKMKDTLGPTLEEILSDRSLNLEINPNKVYQTMLNDIETETGEESPLPRNVTPEEAAENQDVQRIIRERIEKLRDVAAKLLFCIAKSTDGVPYGIRYLGKKLVEKIMVRFPDAPKIKVDSLVGALIILRYYNPAICTPDAHNIIQQKPSPTGRRNLILIAKVLQNLSNNVKFGEKEKFMIALNSFLEDHRSTLTEYLERLIDVEELSVHLSADKYLALAGLQDSTLSIGANDLYYLHTLLHKHRESVCKTEADEDFAQLLNDLADPPEQLSRADDFYVNLDLVEGSSAGGRKSSDIDDAMADDGESELEELEEVLSDILRQMPDGNYADLSLVAAIDLAKRRAVAEENYAFAERAKAATELIASLHRRGVLTEMDEEQGYRQLLRKIVERAAQAAALERHVERHIHTLENALLQIRDHHAYLTTKVTAYQEYLRNVKKQSFETRDKKKKKKEKKADKKGSDERKFSHSQLLELGVISESRVSPQVKKSVQFRFIHREAGVFDVVASFKGIKVVKMQVDFEDLLEKQHNNTLYIETEYVTLSVNMLVHMLNQYFIIDMQQAD